MLAVEFDKLVNAYARIWDAIWGREGSIIRHCASEPHIRVDLERYVTFNYPMRELPGKHGPGRALGVKKDAKFSLELFEELRACGAFSHFQFKLPRHSKHGVADPRTEVLPAKDAPDPDHVFNRLTGRERAIVGEIDRGFCRLTGPELRALGTHYSRRSTEKFIRREFVYALKPLDACISRLRQSGDLGAEAGELASYAAEAVLKSTDNKPLYERARGKVLAELRDRNVIDAFKDSQPPAGEIWTGDELETLRREAIGLRGTAWMCVASALAGDAAAETKESWGYDDADAEELWATGVGQSGHARTQMDAGAVSLRKPAEMEPWLVAVRKRAEEVSRGK